MTLETHPFRWKGFGTDCDVLPTYTIIGTYGDKAIVRDNIAKRNLTFSRRPIDIGYASDDIIIDGVRYKKEVA